MASSGLRNKRRNGKGPYHRQGKKRYADRYGTFANGDRKTADTIHTDRRAVDTVIVEVEPNPVEIIAAASRKAAA